MKYLEKLTKAIRKRENLPTIREVMTVDEVMQYLVNYGLYGERFIIVKNELKKNEHSDFLEEIVCKITADNTELAERGKVSNYSMPEDIKIAIRQYDFVPVESNSSDKLNGKTPIAEIEGTLDKIQEFSDKISVEHDKLKDFTFQLDDIPKTDVKLSKNITTVLNLYEKHL